MAICIYSIVAPYGPGHIFPLRTYLSLQWHQLRVQLAYSQHPGIVGGWQGRDVSLLQVHAFGWPAAGSEGVVAVLSPNAFFFHWPRAAGGGLVRAGAAGVLFHCLHKNNKYYTSVPFRTATQQCLITFTYKQMADSSDFAGLISHIHPTHGTHLFLGINLKVTVTARVTFLHIIITLRRKRKETHGYALSAAISCLVLKNGNLKWQEVSCIHKTLFPRITWLLSVIYQRNFLNARSQKSCLCSNIHSSLFLSVHSGAVFRWDNWRLMEWHTCHLSLSCWPASLPVGPWQKSWFWSSSSCSSTSPGWISACLEATNKHQKSIKY